MTPLIRIRIADCPLNQDSTFWKSHIGKTGVKLSVSADGLADVSFGDPPVVVDGVDPKRFEELSEVIPDDPRLNRRLAWRRFFVSMEITGIILAFFAICCVLYWCL